MRSNKKLSLIVDFGANKGQNLEYYLNRADKVIAVEANSNLCLPTQEQFEAEVKSGRLKILNAAVTHEDSQQFVNFVIAENDIFSSLEPTDKVKLSSQVVKVRAASAANLLQNEVGPDSTPDYVKIDLEGSDLCAIESLFSFKIFPTYLSFECHSLQPLNLVLQQNLYKSFMIIQGSRVHKTSYINQTTNQKIFFAKHSAGAFGKDLEGKWYSSKFIEQLLILDGLGWKDIHCSKLDMGNSSPIPLMIKLSTRNILRAMYHQLVPFSARRKIGRAVYLLNRKPKSRKLS